MKKIVALIFALVLAFTVIACGEDKASGYKINFETNGGNELSSITIEEGNSNFMDSIPTPTREGYTFGGWYTDKSLTQKWTGTLNGEFTIYAKWSINSYTLSFETFTGSNPEDIELKYNQDIPVIPNPSQKGHVFAGWYTDENFENAFNYKQMPAKDVTLYAKWTVNQYTVKFFVDNIFKSEVSVNYNSSVPAESLPENPSKKGYEFKGWKVDGADFTASTKVTDNIDVHASFEIKKYNIKFVVDGVTTTREFEFDSTISAITSPEKEGYTFNEWTIYDEESDSHVPFSFQNKKMPDHDIEVHAAWTINKYSISFELLLGTGVENLYDIPFDSDIIISEVPTKTGHTFDGWYLDDQYNTEFNYDKMPAKNLTLYAKWVPINYKVTFVNYNGAELQSSELAYGSIPTYKGEVPTKLATAEETFTFVGWDKEFNPVSADITFTAQYSSSKNVYTVTWVSIDNNGHEYEYKSNGVVNGEKIETPNNPIRTGYEFVGWDNIPEKMPANNITIKATWKAIEYTITFLAEDGSEIQKGKVAYDTTPSKPQNPTKAADVQYTYVFAGWKSNGVLYQEIPTVKGDATYTATFTPVERKYTINWVNHDGSELLTKDDVLYSDAIVAKYSGATPTKASTVQFSYKFDKWSEKVVNSENSVITYTAQFTEITNKYLIKFVDEDDNVLDSAEFEYGTKPVYNGSEPTKLATAQYTYTFAGWSPEVVNVEGEATYTAQFSSTVNKYLITFEHEDGTVLQSGEIEFGQLPVYVGETPVKTATAQYTYTFDGWSPKVVSVAGVATYTAQFSSTVNKYSITFVNYDNEELQSYDLEYGSIPGYNGQTPTKPATAEETFTFVGWDKEFNPVTGDIVYKAQFSSEKNIYTVTWMSVDNNGQLYEYKTTSVVNGNTIEAPAAPTREGYTFTDWDNIPEKMPANNITIKATWKAIEYTITFLAEDGSEIQKGKVAYDTTPSKPQNPTKAADVQYTYVFAGWKSNGVLYQEIPTVKGDATYTATFTPVERKYTINWVNHDGSELLTKDDVLYSDAIVAKYSGATPTKASTVQFSYKFDKWSEKDVDSENSVITYSAQFIATERSYTVTWVDGNGQTIDTDLLKYGTMPEYTGTVPTKDSTVQYSYTFASWSPELTKVVGDVTYTAQFSSTVNEYTITFVNYDGSELQSSKVAYGSMPSYKGETPLKEQDVQYTYEFAGWSPEVEIVSGVATYKAQFTSVLRSYTITWVDGDGKSTTDSVEYGKLPTAPANPTKTATAEYTYTFKSWSPAIIEVDGEMTYTATFDAIANSYNIIWNSIDKDGNVYEYHTSEVAYGSIIATPNDPERMGYSFAGWLNVPSSMPAKDITISANWTAYKYVISFNGNDATSGSTATQEFTYDVAQTLRTNGYLRTGYNFVGWNTAPDGSGTSFDDNESVENLSTTNNGSVVLYAQWTEKEYKVVINMDDCISYESVEPLELNVPYNKVLIDYLNENNFKIDRTGHTYEVYRNDTLVENFSIYRVEDVNETIEFNVKYTPLKYKVSIIIDGKYFYTSENEIEYGTEFTYEMILAEYREKAMILNKLANVIQGYMPYILGGFSDYAAAANQEYLDNFHNSLSCFEKGVDEEGNIVYKTYGDVINEFPSLATDYGYFINGNWAMAYGADAANIQKFISVINVEYSTYLSIAQHNIPVKDGYIFKGWVLGSDTTYGETGVSGTPYQGCVPEGKNNESSIVALFEKAGSLNLTSNDNLVIDENGKPTISWENNWGSFINENLPDYYNYSEDSVNFVEKYVIYSYNSEADSLYELGSTTDKKYTFMTDDTFSLPGSYNIVVIATIYMYDDEGNYITSFKSAMHTPIEVELIPNMDNATLTDSGKYFYIYEAEDGKYIYLFTNTTYNFSNYVEVSTAGGNDSTNFVTVTYSDAVEDITANTATTFVTTNNPGNFIIKSYTVYNPKENIYEYEELTARVFPTITSFDFGEGLGDFRNTINNPDSYEFLNESETDTYKIGVRNTELKTIVDGETVYMTDYPNNGVKIVVDVLTNGGYSVNYSSYTDYLVYQYYKFTGNTWVQIDTETEQFVIRDGNVFEFMALDGVSKYKMVVSIGPDYVPLAYLDVIKPIELTFELNNGINVYKHETLQKFFANLNYNEGINLHKDIIVKTSDAEIYLDGLYKINPGIALLANLSDEEMKLITKSGNKSTDRSTLDYRIYKNDQIPYSTAKTGSNMEFDKSLLNLNTWELHHMLVKAYEIYKEDINAGNYKEYFDFVATFRTGNPYFRGAIVPEGYSENYKIYGNYFEVDGSNVGYMSVNSVNNLSNVDGYYIPTSYSSIFNYNVHSNVKDYNDLMVTNYEIAFFESYENSLSKLTFNDLLITGNTTTAHAADDNLTGSAITLMNRNAGGLSGITSNFGGNIEVNNSVIRGTTLGVAMRFEGKLNVNHTYILSSWAHSLYLTDAGDANVSNCYFKDSGGPAIFVEDTESNYGVDASGNKYTSNNVVNIDALTRIENYVVGTEGYFNAYGMTAAVLTLKGQIEDGLNKADTPLTSVITKNNYLNLPTQMINFTFMVCCAGGNNEKNKSTATSHIKINAKDVYGNTITHSAGVNVPGQNDRNLVTLGPDGENLMYFLLSYPVPGKGNSVLGLGVDLYTPSN